MAKDAIERMFDAKGRGFVPQDVDNEPTINQAFADRELSTEADVEEFARRVKPFVKQPEFDNDEVITPERTGFGQVGQYFEDRFNNPDKGSDDIRNLITQQMQREISATEDIYADLVTRQEGVNKANLGTSRAIQARGGLLGSDFGAAQTQTTMQTGQDQIGSIQAEKAAAIAEIMGLGNQRIVDEIRKKREAQASSAQDYMTYLEGQQDRNLERGGILANSLIAQGIDPRELSPEELTEIAKSYQLSEDEVLSAYMTSLPEETTPENIKLSEGQAVFDPLTGERIAYNPKTYKPESEKNRGKFTSKDIPDDVYTDLVADVSNPEATLSKLYSAYPEVDSKYIENIYKSLNSKTTSGNDDDDLLDF